MSINGKIFRILVKFLEKIGNEGDKELYGNGGNWKIMENLRHCKIFPFVYKKNNPH